LSLDSIEVIGTHGGSLYKLSGLPAKAMVHDSDNICNIWNSRLGHLHHQALPLLRKMVTILLEFVIEHQGVCRGCALRKNPNIDFQSIESRSKEIMDMVNSYVCGSMSVPFMSGF
jgi:hypothetical protein